MFLHKNFKESIEKQIYEISYSYFLKDIKVLSAHIFNNKLILILCKSLYQKNNKLYISFWFLFYGKKVNKIK